MKNLVLIAFLALGHSSMACCGKGADIYYTAITESYYRFEVVSYSCLSAPDDLPEITISVDQGESVAVTRTDVQDFPSLDIRISRYVLDHGFDVSGMHTVDATLGGRGGGMVNIPNSIGETVCIQAKVLAGPCTLTTGSIHFSSPTYAIEQNGNIYNHAPGPYDLDGDSLYFEWTTPNGDFCAPIPGYTFPSAVNSIELSGADGLLTWDLPPFNGAFSITIKGSEFRGGELIGQVTRDLVICVTGIGSGTASYPGMEPLRISPTITDGIVHFIEGAMNGTWITIVDGSGRVAMEHHEPDVRGSVDITSLASGPYLIRVVERDGKVYTGMVIKR